MLRIAIISDIHANFPALEETLKSIDENDIDAVYCLGDLVGYNIWPNAVINEIRKRKIPTICGSLDPVDSASCLPRNSLILPKETSINWPSC